MFVFVVLGEDASKTGDAVGHAHCQQVLHLFSIVNIGLIICRRETQVKHAWNSEDRSLNIFVKVSFSIFSMVMIDQHHSCHQKPHHLGQEDDKLTFHRHPVAQSTDCIRAKVS